MKISTMNSRRAAIVVGTRPEAIKMAPVYLAMKKDPRTDVSLVTTAQHREMLDQVFSVFGIRPDLDMDLMQPNQSLGELSARILVHMRDALQTVRPDIVLVHGDTSTCLFSALAAFYEKIPIAHVEAGLRTYNLKSPWPEEMSRRLTDPLCRWCFAPTQGAAENLRAERIPEENIIVTGNTVVDALLLARDKVYGKPPTLREIPPGTLDDRRLILVTGHRRESFGKPLKDLCMALREIVAAHEDTVLIYPAHLNPNVKAPVFELLGGLDRIHLIKPVKYLEFVYLMDRSNLIITDSGGIQEEAPTFGKPVLVAREVTERPEAMANGLAKLVGTSRERIIREATLLLEDETAYRRMCQGNNPYGDGQASKRILESLCGGYFEQFESQTAAQEYCGSLQRGYHSI
jgi:UDP-N-acetylglucosamine 2-epimerase